MLVRELMTRRLESTAPNTTLADAARRMRDSNIGCLPVGDGNNLIGMLTEEDFTTRATAGGMNPTTTTVSEIMTKGVIYCQDDDTVEDALDIMRTRNIHHLPVRNSSNTLVGMLSLSDLAFKGPSEYHADVARLAFGNASTGQASATTQLL